MPSSRTSNHQLVKEALENDRVSRTTRESTPPQPAGRDLVRESGHGSTPIKVSSNKLQAAPTVTAMKTVLEAELAGGMQEIAVGNDTIYQSFANNKIRLFIQKCDLYDKKKKIWKDVRTAEQAGGEIVLYRPLEEIIEKIFKDFKGPDGEQRWVKDTHSVRMSHIEGGHVWEDKEEVDTEKKRVTLKSSPDLSILGHGLHFSGSRARPQFPHYDHCLCPVEIKQATTFKARHVVIQAGVYARQCFIHQPHRRYVPVVVIAGSKLYLYIYDRSGVLRSHAIDIHQDPDTFVRIILGVAAVGTDTRFSTFDPRVRYESNADHPTVIVADPALNRDAKYEDVCPRFSRKSIRGRGTYCADAKIATTGVAVLIKEAWRSLDRMPEYVLRDKIKGLAGVGQILSYEDDKSTITDFRKHVFSTFCESNPYELDRKFCRLVLQAYGRSIRCFRTKLELLEAFHDAVMGHKYLWEKGILHRDVSVDNILLGEPGAGEGYRGVLIDFDMAIDVNALKNASDQEKSQLSKFRTGTRAFQSYSVLKSVDWKTLAPPQDHVDDLESYLYCLAWICIKYDGTPFIRSPEILNSWEEENPGNCANHKNGFLTDPTSPLTDYFSTPIFKDLFVDLSDLSRIHVQNKVSYVRKAKFPLLPDVHKATAQGEDHLPFLKIVKTAIEAQKKEPAEEGRQVETTTQYALSQVDGEFSEITYQSAPSTSEINYPGLKKRPNPSANEEDGQLSSSKRVRTQASGSKASGSKASGSKASGSKASGSKASSGKASGSKASGSKGGKK